MLLPADAPVASDAQTSYLARAHASDAGAPGSVYVKFTALYSAVLQNARESITRARSIYSRNTSIRAAAVVTTPTCARPCAPSRAHSSAHTSDGNGKRTWTLALAGSLWRESLFRDFLLLERCSLKLPPSF